MEKQKNSVNEINLILIKILKEIENGNGEKISNNEIFFSFIKIKFSGLSILEFDNNLDTFKIIYNILFNKCFH